MGTPSKPLLLLESILVWLATIGLISALYRLRSISWIGGNLSLITGLILIYLPTLIFFLKKESFDFFERNLRDLRDSLWILILVSFLLFPLFLVGNHLFQTHFLHTHYFPLKDHSKLYNAFFFHLFLVALPEEFFFRGYFLSRMQQVFKGGPKFFGVRMGIGFFLTSGLFALSHSLIEFQIWHILIFFPGLIFGWLKEKTGGLTAPILFHAFCNLCSIWVGMHYR